MTVGEAWGLLLRMETISTAISVVALCVSIFSLYWTSLRKKRSLTLVAINVLTDMSVDFVLANGGNCDLFMIKAICSLRGSDKNSSLILKQQYIFQDSNRGLIQTGKTIAFKLKFLEKLEGEDLLFGEENKQPFSILHMFDLKLDVYWIEPSGEEFQAECIFGRYGFDDAGEVRWTQELRRNFALYERKVAIPIGSRPNML